MGKSTWGLRVVLGAFVLLAIVGCAQVEPSGVAAERLVYPPRDKEHHVGSQSIDVFYSCRQAGSDQLHLDGVVWNRANMEPIRYFWWELVGLDARGHVVSSGRGQARDDILRTNQASPVTLTLKLVGSEVRFDLYYEYDFPAERFSSAMLASAGSAWPLLARTERRGVTDACNPTLHKVR